MPPATTPGQPILRFRTVVFDCDSTLSAIEGIDELAGEHRSAVTELTEAAMRGEVPLQDVYGRRLALIRPPGFPTWFRSVRTGCLLPRVVAVVRAVVMAVRTLGPPLLGT